MAPPLLVRAREIDWLSKEDQNAALGRADDPTTGAKETPGFHRPSVGKPNSHWVLTGCQKKAPKCGRWVVLMTQRPAPKRLLVVTDQVWANQTVNEFTEEDVGLGSSATTGSPIVWPLLHTHGLQTRTHTSVVGSSPRPNTHSQNCHTEKDSSNSQFLMGS